MNKGKHKRKRKGKAKATADAKVKGLGRVTPGILLSWEDFNETALREWMDELADQAADDLDRLERALRSEN